MRGPVEREEADWDWTVALDLRGNCIACKHALPSMPGQSTVGITRQCVRQRIRADGIMPGLMNAPIYINVVCLPVDGGLSALAA